MSSKTTQSTPLNNSLGASSTDILTIRQQRWTKKPAISIHSFLWDVVPGNSRNLFYKSLPKIKQFIPATKYEDILNISLQFLKDNFKKKKI